MAKSSKIKNWRERALYHLHFISDGDGTARVRALNRAA